MILYVYKVSCGMLSIAYLAGRLVLIGFELSGIVGNCCIHYVKIQVL